MPGRPRATRSGGTRRRRTCACGRAAAAPCPPHLPSGCLHQPDRESGASRRTCCHGGPPPS